MFKLTKLAKILNSFIRLALTAFLLSFVGHGLVYADGKNTADKESDLKPWAAIGRAPTAAEIKAWDIDVLSDFSGLPPGKGTVDQGIDIWEAKCASCHGVFGESNEVFTPLVGGTTDEDIESGHVAALASGGHPHRTTMMRLSQISTLWDYINRAMPWNAPKSLSADEVYAVIAYMLNLAEIVDEDFEFSNENIADVQARLPNRNGMKKFEPMWFVNGQPDVQGDSCMTNCEVKTEVTSSIPEYARNDHGNLADQNRLIGPYRGTDTTQPPPATLSETQQMVLAVASQATPATTDATPGTPDPVQELAQSSGCLACHAIDKKGVGPALQEIAKRYRDDKTAIALLSDRVRNGASGTWGAIPMPANAHVNETQAASLVRWILSL